MFYDKELIADTLRQWESCLMQFDLPSWEQLPPLDLYMDQVIALLGQYLGFLPAEESAGRIVTPTAINNYVRMRIMPPPKKKKYSRTHIAYLIMICALKQSVSIAHIQKMIPMGLTEEQVRSLYNDFTAQHKRACVSFLRQVEGAVTRDVMSGEGGEDNAVGNFVTACAVSAGFYRQLAETIVKLQRAERQPEQSVPNARKK